MHLRLEESIDAPADAVWRVLGTEFATIDRWATFVKTSRIIDRSEVPPSMSVAASAPVPGRETVTKAKLIEVLTAYSDERRSLTFDAVGLPKVVRRAVDVQTVTETGESSCLVSFDITFDFIGPFAALGPLMKNRVSRTLGGVLEDLKRHVEATETE